MPLPKSSPAKTSPNSVPSAANTSSAGNPPPAECFLVGTLIHAKWLLRRYSLVDTKVWDYGGTDDRERDDPNGMGLTFIRGRQYFRISRAVPIPHPKGRHRRRNPKPISPNSNRLSKNWVRSFILPWLGPPIAPNPCHPRSRLTRKALSDRCLNLRGRVR
jgi:hypothetical protein